MDRTSRIAWWSVPMIAAILIALVGWWVHRTLERSMKLALHAQLSAVLDSDVTGLRVWMEGHQHAHAATVRQPEVVDLVEQLLAMERRGGATPVVLRRAPQFAELRRRMKTVAEASGYVGWILISPSGLNLAGSRDEVVGRNLIGDNPRIRKMLQGETVLAPPFFLGPSTAEVSGIHAADVILFVGGPVRDAAGEILAGLAFRISPKEFTRILTAAQMGDSGETYAFDANGVMLSLSRFNDDLREIGLLPADPLAESSLNVEIRNPGGNMLRGFVPTVPRKAQPLTRMAADAVTGGSGVDVEGYADYRGVPVVGAWKWLPEFGMGVGTEVDVSEAYGSLLALRQGFWVLFGLLAVSGVGILVYTRLVVRLRSKVETVEKLGQYHLVKKIGEGGMGKVYLAKHALLRRPTAIKLIRSADQSHILRFEREVQFTAQLCHPNTIAIYDYGHTPDGVFYYAMEYLQGTTLSRLVESGGPLSEGRAIHILNQVCGSLAEAHAAGLVHRDIKPANIILSQRGGQSDFVKVLDFGLVRQIDQAGGAGLTQADSFVGTPHYISPEAVMAPDTVDARSDIYAVGALGFFLLTGRPVFVGGAYEVVGQHVNTPPESPSAVLGRPISSDLEGLILRCLEKKKEARPAAAEELVQGLESCGSSGTWSRDDARAWWEARPAEADVGVVTDVSASQPTLFRVDLDDRGGSRPPKES